MFEAVEVRPGIFVVEFLKPEHQESATLVWKYETGDVLAAVSAFYHRGNEKRTRTDFMTAVVDGKQGGAPIIQASSLVGKRVLYRYSADDWYEHVYLGAQTMAWHCVNGAEKGMADVERGAYFDVADDLYVLFWTETVMPVESVIVVDLAQMRSVGRFFCWDPKPEKLIHLTFGSKATVLNETAYPASF
ncbi:MoaF C-terminal domain-containing protein [Pseudomonas sp. MPDS]|uniref:MoaF C-terminal domain-containing protein n=1 Tax=Pseudomonas sp. MPDS TaxID=2762896 RepID=UPI001564C755|nr:MoaF C-terminal domain-containing protein [Pseudomonas sp. MPDS]QKJ35464.1 MoaF N-terminal domain-containing protein [Pseudomonas sp. MPDS]